MLGMDYSDSSAQEISYHVIYCTSLAIVMTQVWLVLSMDFPDGLNE